MTNKLCIKVFTKLDFKKKLLGLCDLESQV